MMETQTSFSDGVLTVKRTYDAPREAVFDAWVETSKTEQWWGCGDTAHVKSEIEPHVGGKYVHEMTIRDVGTHPVSGVLTAFEPPALLEYAMAGPTPKDNMQVRVEFMERDGMTDVCLTQTAVPEGLDNIVTAGWQAAFEKLKRFLAQSARAA